MVKSTQNIYNYLKELRLSINIISIIIKDPESIDITKLLSLGIARETGEKILENIQKNCH